MNQSRRDALKKLGIGTGVAWAAPAVTVLVVPTHASATSSSGPQLVGTFSIVAAEYDAGGGSLVVISSSIVLDSSYTVYVKNASDSRNDYSLSFSSLAGTDYIFNAPSGSTIAASNPGTSSFTADIYLNSTLVQASATVSS